MKASTKDQLLAEIETLKSDRLKFFYALRNLWNETDTCYRDTKICKEAESLLRRCINEIK